MHVAEKNPVTSQWGFLGLFILYVILLVGMAELSRDSMVAFREFTASAITALWGVFSVPVVCSGTILTFAGFTMEIVLECTALHYMIIFVSGVLAFRSHDLQYRAFGIVLGTVIIFLLNAVRIGVIGLIGRYCSDVFAFVHEYLWQGTFALSVVLLWLLWVKGRQVFSRRLTVHLMMVFVSASLSFWLAVRLLDTYVAILAFLSNYVFAVLSPLVDIPQSVIADDRLIGYVVGDKVIYSRTTLYVLNAALLIPIASLTFVQSQWKLILKRLSAAVLLLGAQHQLIVVFDWLLEVAQAPNIHSVLIWCIVMTTFTAPMLSWLVAMNIFRAKPVSDNNAPSPKKSKEHHAA